MSRTSLATVSVLILVAVGGPAAAQIPDEFTNLKVLPGDIGKRELVNTMRGFAGALGVRWTQCHPGPAPGPWRGVWGCVRGVACRRLTCAVGLFGSASGPQSRCLRGYALYPISVVRPVCAAALARSDSCV